MDHLQGGRSRATRSAVALGTNVVVAIGTKVDGGTSRVAAIGAGEVRVLPQADGAAEFKGKR